MQAVGLLHICNETLAFEVTKILCFAGIYHFLENVLEFISIAIEFRRNLKKNLSIDLYHVLTLFTISVVIGISVGVKNWKSSQRNKF